MGCGESREKFIKGPDKTELEEYVYEKEKLLGLTKINYENF